MAYLIAPLRLTADGIAGVLSGGPQKKAGCKRRASLNCTRSSYSDIAFPIRDPPPFNEG
jgi:hypothetical protein